MFARHSLVWLAPAGWRAAAAAAAPAHAPAIGLWRERDWPLVARRNEADPLSAEICLGLAPPPSPDPDGNGNAGARLRIAVRALHAHVTRSAPPLTVAQALAAAPERWRQPLAGLAGDGAGLGLDLRVYGSLALQALTGLDYLRPGSDIDLLLAPATPAQLQAGLALLASYAATLPLDGEVVFPNGEAVAWKEWSAARGGQARVLAKSVHGVRLAGVDALLATLEAA